MEHIFETVAVETALLKSFPPQLAITAFGKVNSGGWKNGSLEPRYYLLPPSDGIQDFDFVASPPVGTAIQVILPVTAHYVIQQIPDWLSGVRVHSKSNSVEVKLNDSKHYPIA
jgi:hypothetical protein